MGLADAAADRRIWLRVFAPLALICAVWALAVPLMTGPDERDQAVRAAAVVRGELVGEPVEGWKNVMVDVRVPEAFGTANSDCFLGWLHRDFIVFPVPLTPECDSMTGDSHLVDATTYEHRAQPPYFFAVGLPTLLFPSEFGAYVMRFVNILMCCTLLASGLVSLRRLARQYPLALVGAAVALTPTVFYLSATINSMGLEIAASFCLWATGLAIVRGPDEIDGRLVRRLGLALVVLVLARGSSPGFAVIILGALALLAGRERLRALWRRRDVRGWLLAGAGGAALSVGWLLYIHAEYPLEHRAGTGLRYALSELSWFSREMVGVFGATDVAPPLVIQLLWFGAVAAVVVLGWLQGGRRDLLLAVVLGAGGLAILVSGEGFSVPQTGFYWQGRYVMPLLIGAVLVASASGRPSRQRGLVLLPVLLVGQVWSLLYAMRHYSVGFDGPRDPRKFLFDPIWSPPIAPPVVLMVLMVVGLGGLALALLHGTDGTDNTDPAEAGTDRALTPVGAA